jgi:SusD family.
MEPKVRLANSLSSNIPGNIINPTWTTLNSALSTANDVIIQIEDVEGNEATDIVVDGTDRTAEVLAAAYFLRGWSHGRLANLYDQAYVLTAETDLANLEFSGYSQVASQAVSDLERANEIANNNSFSLSGTFLPWTNAVSSDQFARIANTVAARVLVSNSRTASENSDLSSVEGYSWGDVLSFTQNGIQETVSMTLDGFPGDWIDSYQYLSVRVKWYYRVDNRLLNLMDSDYPVKYPTDEAQAGNLLPKAQSDDQRLCTTTTTGSGPPAPDAGLEPEGCYFAYVTDLSFFTVSRGPRLFSNYWWARPFALPQGTGSTTPFGASPRPFFLPVENNTMMAEAMIRANGNVGGAQSIINNGTRVENGGLDPLSGADQEEVLNAIFYERDLELYRMVHGQSYYDLRRRSAMQAGTPIHLPVPAGELQTVQAEQYTFGGTGFTSEFGTATGDQAWCEPVNGNVTSTGNVSPNGCNGPYSVPSGSALEANQVNESVQPARAGTQ